MNATSAVERYGEFQGNPGIPIPETTSNVDSAIATKAAATRACGSLVSTKGAHDGDHSGTRNLRCFGGRSGRAGRPSIGGRAQRALHRDNYRRPLATRG